MTSRACGTCPAVTVIYAVTQRGDLAWVFVSDGQYPGSAAIAALTAHEDGPGTRGTLSGATLAACMETLASAQGRDGRAFAI